MSVAAAVAAAAAYTVNRRAYVPPAQKRENAMSMHLNDDADWEDDRTEARYMRNLFCTADHIGSQTGGGVVTWNELQALKGLGGQVDHISAAEANPSAYSLANSPYVQDYLADAFVLQMLAKPINLAHFYSGAFDKTIWRLKNAGTKITQTVAAHDMLLSSEEFAKYGMSYDFPHLTRRELFLTYVEGQLMADKVICPSTQSAEVVKRYGVRDPIVIPHGIPGPLLAPAPLPEKFTVGYLGQSGPDKGLWYLLEAWSKLNMPNCRLLLAGRGIEQLAPIWQHVGGRGEVEFLGWVKDVNEFYDKLSVYVQPSVTEGFGIEVLEAMARGRPVIVSDGAGASNVVTHGSDGFVFPKREVIILCEQLAMLKTDPAKCAAMGNTARTSAEFYTWDKIWPQYQMVWKNLLVDKFVF